jgi:peptidoglycan/LPS O-acetylase OafA/YrhL
LNKQTTYWPELDGLRAVAFLIVFLAHYAPSACGVFTAVLNIYGTWGWIGVDLFFVLSGYLITFLLVKEKFSFNSISIIDFYKRRALRIWPLYFLVLSAASFYPLLSHHWNGYLRLFLQQVIAPFLLFAGNYTMIWQFGAIKQFCDNWNISFAVYVGLLVPLWSLCIEEQFYLFWPGLLNFAKTVKGIYFAIGLLFLCSIGVRLVLVLTALKNGWGHAYYYMDIFSHLDALMVGAGLALTEYCKPGWFVPYTRNAQGWLIFAILSFIFGIIPLTVPSLYERDLSIVPTMTVVAVSFGGVLLLAMNWEPLRNLLRNRLLRSIGKVSYAMYLFHFFLIRLVEPKLPTITGNPEINWLANALIMLGITYVAAQVSWNLLEKRFLKARIKFSKVHSETELLSDQASIAKTPVLV